MNAGSTEARAAALLAFSLMVLACERLAQDPPPPPSRHEVPGAPPAAIGAHVASRPAEPLKVRMVNYHVVQMVCIIVVLLMAAHLITLLSGQPLTPRGGGGGRF